MFVGIKNLLENCIYQGHYGLTVIFYCKDSIKFSLKVHVFFLFQKSLRNLNHRQYGLAYIAYLENIDHFLLEAHIGNSDQDKIWFEPYTRFLL